MHEWPPVNLTSRESAIPHLRPFLWHGVYQHVKSAVARAKLEHMFVHSLGGARDGSDVFPELAPPRAGLYAVASPSHGHLEIRD